MKISTKGRYALRIMLDVAEHSDEESNVSIKEVANRQSISIKYLEQIVNLLVKAGFLRSQRGSRGGYRLSRQPSEYTAGDILRVTEGKMAPVDCLEDEVNMCPRAKTCQTIKLWEGLNNAINSYIDSVTLEELMRDKSQILIDEENSNDNQGFCYTI